MPITKIPIIHKFGIISHSQRQELQERLYRQSYYQSLRSRQPAPIVRKPFDISDEFIQAFNNAYEDLNEREKYEEAGRKMLERAKRRAGVRDGGMGTHVNLPLAWTELAQLAHCKGKLQDDCLDVLITSLDVSPLEQYHIPALFFLAETMLYWFRTDAVHQPFLRTGEIKLLQMGQLVFTRLFYYHMAGLLQGYADFKSRLFTYLDGLGGCQEAYNPYPNAHLSLRFIIEVGKILLSDTSIEPGEVKEGDPLSLLVTNVHLVNQATQELYDRHSNVEGSSKISSSVHDLSPTLWHALDVWRCTNHLSGGFNEAVTALAQCSLCMVEESWLDVVIALHILAEAAKNDMVVMRTLHHLALGQRNMEDGHLSCYSSPRDPSPTRRLAEHFEPYPQPSKVDSTSPQPTMSDGCGERSGVDDPARKKLLPRSQQSLSNQYSKSSSSSGLTDLEDKSQYKSSFKHSTRQADASLLPQEVPFQNMSTQKSQGNGNNWAKPNTLAVSPGFSRPTPDIFHSQYSSPKQFPSSSIQPNAGTNFSEKENSSPAPTYGNSPELRMTGIESWSWEVAITYCELLADICLHGANASIQKMALIGTNDDLIVAVKHNIAQSEMVSAGLLDLAFFQETSEASGSPGSGNSDWSWRIRYGAIQALVKLCRSLENNKNREGLRNTAWSILLKTHSWEKDTRVLEALKVGQVHTHREKFLGPDLQEFPVTLGSRLAAGLAEIYLPPLPPPVERMRPRRTPRKKTTGKAEPSVPPATELKQQRTSLRDEIMLATALYEPPVDLCTRLRYDLKRIVEDQWRKELQHEMDEKEPERQCGLLQRQKEEELTEKQLLEQRQKKLATNVRPTTTVDSDNTKTVHWE